MEREILAILKTGREVCATDLASELNITRQYASFNLSKMERKIDKVTSVHRRRTVGCKIYLVKYYKLLK